MITVNASVKDRFFDRARIVEQLGRADARRLSRMGAFVRRRARTDILRRAPKKRRKDGRRQFAKPGAPPLVHSNDSFANLRNILFSLAEHNNAVVIGPRFVPSLKLQGATQPTVPALLTFGGRAVVEQWSNDGVTWVTGKSPQAEEHRTVTARYHKHPFMGPALEKEIAAGVVDNVFSASSF